MEFCVSYTTAGNEPDGKITLANHLSLKFHFISIFPLCRSLQNVAFESSAVELVAKEQSF